MTIRKSRALLYGPLMHEDELRGSYAAGISVEEMLLNARKTVCSGMLATVDALHLIERQPTGRWTLPKTCSRNLS